MTIDTRTGITLGRAVRVRRVDQNTGAVVHYAYDGDDLVLEVDGTGEPGSASTRTFPASTSRTACGNG